MPTPEDINQQWELLETYRRTLAHLVEQAAQYGGEVFAPPSVANHLSVARDKILSIKHTLREWGARVEDHPNDRPSQVATPPVDFLSPVSPPIQHLEGIKREHWGEAPDVSGFCGRLDALATLEQWIINDQCRLVSVLGTGGVGKTVLAVKLAKHIKDHFDLIIWQSLRNAPPIQDVLSSCLKFLGSTSVRDLQDSIDHQITLLIEHLRQQRCLIIFDNAETLLQAGVHTAQYRVEYTQYSDLFRCIGDTSHRSCILLTSREKPSELTSLEGATSPVRAYTLHGLAAEEGHEMLQDRGLSGTPKQWDDLNTRYAGNPLALKLVAASIRDLFGGDMASFLQAEVGIIRRVRDFLDQQFIRLSDLEQDIMFWLALGREASSLMDVKEWMLSPPPMQDLLEAFESLHRRSLIESMQLIAEPRHVKFILQSVILEYLTERLIAQACQEIQHEQVGILTSHALLRAQGKETVKNQQARLILTPIAERLRIFFGTQEAIDITLARLLTSLHQRSPLEQGYAPGNVLNLLCYFNEHHVIRDYDFSSLIIRQVDLRRARLFNVNFAHAEFISSLFAETFGNILCVAFSPDGTVLASGSANGEIHLRQAAGGDPLEILKGHTDWIRSIAFSPDGHTLASGSDDGTVRLWNYRTAECRDVLELHPNAAFSVAFSPDGTLLACGGDDWIIRLWDVNIGQPVKTLSDHTYLIWSVVFSPDGHTLASGSDDCTIRLWDVETGQCRTVMRGHERPIQSIAFSPDGRTLASGSDDCTIRLWDVETGQCRTVMRGHDARIQSIAFGLDGHTLASGSDDCTIRLWDVEAAEWRSTLQGHTNTVWSVVFSPDGNTLASGSDDQTVRLWEVATGQCLQTLQGYTNQVRSLALSPDNHTLASGYEDGAVRFWDLRIDQCFKTLVGHTNRTRSVAFSPDGRILASASQDQSVRLWDMQKGTCYHILQGHTNWVWAVAFSPDGTTLVSGSDDQTVRVWNVHNGECLHTFVGNTARVLAVAFHPHGSFFATAGDDQTVKLLDVRSGECLQTFVGHTNRVLAVAFHPHGTILASAGDDLTVKLWNIKTGECIISCQGHTRRIWSIVFSPDGHLLASGSEDRMIMVWNVQTGQIYRILGGHTDTVWSVIFNSDSHALVSGSKDETICFWDMQTGTLLKILQISRPYEGVLITGLRGITESQRYMLLYLGAIEAKG